MKDLSTHQLHVRMRSPLVRITNKVGSSVGSSRIDPSGWDNFFANRSTLIFNALRAEICNDPRAGETPNLCEFLNATDPCNEQVELFCNNFTTPNDCCRYENLSDCCGDNFGDFETNPELYTFNNLAGYSSRGPTYDYRFKPEVVCPGDYIFSSKSHGRPSRDTEDLCEPELYDPGATLTAMTGTSMATPICAGHAALLRQYILEGHFGPGTNRTDPPSHMIKAMLLNGAVSLDGIMTLRDDDPITLPSFYPNNFVGYGRMNLANSVPRMIDSAYNVLFVSMPATIHQGQSVVIMCFTVVCDVLIDVMRQTDDRFPVTITMSYLDPPASPAVAISIVNDLDLVIRYNSEVVPYDVESSKQVFDSVNNNERAVFNVSVGGTSVDVHVHVDV